MPSDTDHKRSVLVHAAKIVTTTEQDVVNALPQNGLSIEKRIPAKRTSRNANVRSPESNGHEPVGRRSLSINGKFFSNRSDSVLLRGVTYGPFRPGIDGIEYPCKSQLQNDLAIMRESGVNAIRTYTVPPDRLIAAAEQAQLHIVVGLPWEQHIAFLDGNNRERDILHRLRDSTKACGDSPAIAGFAIGNEIPAPIVRWHGAPLIARFLREAYEIVKSERPNSLVTYVNYPTTEYLQSHLSFLDFVSFNVYLESQESYGSYLTRLQTLAGEKPLVLAEIGLDSRRNGLERQAEMLDRQIRVTFERGAAGAFVFSWTDAWFRGGDDVDDWDFGLTDRAGKPKQALESVAMAFSDLPVSNRVPKPRMSVVICSYNGRKTIGPALQAVQQLDYPDYEVIVVDDGSTDDTSEIAAAWNVRLIRTENMGLSAARNTGWRAAKGEVVAYLDDDAYPDKHWLSYLAEAFHRSDFAAVGGPNLLPPGSSLIERAINAAPGNPIHVLLSDETAEHIPGCNMAIRKDALEQIGGFDPVFRIAGDDVDLCWRLNEAGLEIGFHPGAVVFHKRRGSTKAFLKQQFNYGKAEALLERKWPQKYNRLGHPRWGGRIYNSGLPFPRPFARTRIYYGVWGSNPFQSEETRSAGLASSLQATPEWYLLVLALTALTLCGLLWKPLFLAAPLLLVSVSTLVVRAILNTRGLSHDARFTSGTMRRGSFLRLRAIQLSLLQPAARLLGRLRLGLTPWRPRFTWKWRLPRTDHKKIWSEKWKPIGHWITDLESRAVARGIPVNKCGPYSRCDLIALGGLFGLVRVRTAIEEHGHGRQLIHFRLVPYPTATAFLVMTTLALLLTLALAFNSIPASILFGSILMAAALLTLRDCAAASATMSDSVSGICSSLEPSTGDG